MSSPRVHDKHTILTPHERRLVEEARRRGLPLPGSFRLAIRPRGIAHDGLWRNDLYDGKQRRIASPPRFDRFIVSDAFLGFSDVLPGAERPGLTPRQEAFLRSGFSFEPEHVFDVSKKITQAVACWGKGCLAGDTLLRDWDGIARPAAEWADLGTPLYLPVWNGSHIAPAIAGPVYRKGVAPLYRVILADGREFTGTAFHKVLTPDGYRAVEQLVPGVSRVWVRPASECGVTGDVAAPEPNPNPNPHPEFRLGAVRAHDAVFGPWETHLADYNLRDNMSEYLRYLQYSACGGGDPRQGGYWERVLGIESQPEAPFYDLTVPGYWNYFDASGINHSNSGKDFISSLFFAWLAFVVSSFRDPWEYLGHGHGDPIDMINIATNSAQARTVFFAKLQARLRRPCFSQFLRPGDITMDLVKFHRTVPGYLEPLLLLQIHSLHAQNEAYEGKSPLAWLMDEADAFEDRKGESTAKKCYGTLTSSARSRFTNRFVGIIISYRRVQDGFMDQRQAEAAASAEMVWDEGTTFEILPHKKREDFQVDYDRDERDALAKYENQAPPTIDAFITHPRRVTDAQVKGKKQAAEIEVYENEVYNKDTGVRAKFVALRLHDLKLDPNRVYFIHGDPGEKDCSFGLSLVHVETSRGVSRGLDRDPDDHYDGDPLTDTLGHPLCDRVVAYFDANGQEAGRVTTDYEGKHRIWLPRGVYWYAFYDQYGMIRRSERAVYVAADGHVIEVDTGAKEPNGDAIYEQRRVFPIISDLALEWVPRPDATVDFENVGDIIIEIAKLVPVQMVTFDKWNSVGIIQRLLKAGINAQDMPFTNAQQMAAYKNLRTLAYTGMVELLPDDADPHKMAERQATQLRKVRCRHNTKIEPGEGVKKDMADALATATYFASQNAAFVTALDEGLPMVTGRELAGGAASVLPGQTPAFVQALQAGSSASPVLGPDDEGVSPYSDKVPYR